MKKSTLLLCALGILLGTAITVYSQYKTHKMNVIYNQLIQNVEALTAGEVTGVDTKPCYAMGDVVQVPEGPNNMYTQCPSGTTISHLEMCNSQLHDLMGKPQKPAMSCITKIIYQ